MDYIRGSIDMTFTSDLSDSISMDDYVVSITSKYSNLEWYNNNYYVTADIDATLEIDGDSLDVSITAYILFKADFELDSVNVEEVNATGGNFIVDDNDLYDIVVNESGIIDEYATSANIVESITRELEDSSLAPD